MNTHQHWETVYHTKDSAQVSWYAPHLETSLQLIKRLAPSTQARILDVGSGASTLPDDLLAAGYRQLSMLDISKQALEITQTRLGEQAKQVQWLVGDILEIEFAPQSLDVWHDRAVFHFLTEKAQRERYVQQVLHAVKPNGHVIMATFGTEGPKQCSGLEVMRYDSHSLHHEFGATFRLLDSLTVKHQTPTGMTQQFLYCYCRVE
ncbi:class I SAM-dependent methyltransferase [uncultured Thiothrix sp.]|jgi:SAM-dependent methyltransferase|uniref:class I SAM-dependent methyltransferase n=1 Tax=uncultured Thiothrix sp. TaxID=223185 RepID=UPI002634AD3A|nr:class I SAM-dependent methyltransferase [uncultured Thiothrix sp.]HMT91512.1 class I SAM-dependent methyltransferase [Thiolinea sp.]